MTHPILQKFEEEFYSSIADFTDDNHHDVEPYSMQKISAWCIAFFEQALLSRDQELLGWIEGLYRGAPKSNDIPLDWGVELEGDSRERKGYNTALSNLASKIKENPIQTPTNTVE